MSLLSELFGRFVSLVPMWLKSIKKLENNWSTFCAYKIRIEVVVPEFQ